MRDLLNACGVLLTLALTIAVSSVAVLVASWCVRKTYHWWRRF